MLRVKLLHPDAKVPTVEHPGEDLGYDLYALEDTELHPYNPVKVRTGIAIEFSGRPVEFSGRAMGAVIKDRSSLASQGIFTAGGVIDAGYRGEILVIMRCSTPSARLLKGQKIAQMIPTLSLTNDLIKVVDDLEQTVRGDKGFGSSGR